MTALGPARDHPRRERADRAPLRADAALRRRDGSRRSTTAWPAARSALAGAAAEHRRSCASATSSCRACTAATATSSPCGSCPAGRPLVLFTRPEHAKEIFAGDPEVFHAGKGNAILGPDHGRALAAAAGRRRAQAGPQAADAGVQRPRAARLRAAGRATLANDGGRPLAGRVSRSAALDRMNALTLEVILRVVFGVTDERAAGPAAPAGEPHRRHQPGRAAGLGLSRPCSGSDPGGATVENQLPRSTS